MIYVDKVKKKSNFHFFNFVLSISRCPAEIIRLQCFGEDIEAATNGDNETSTDPQSCDLAEMALQCVPTDFSDLTAGLDIFGDHCK